jgi:hypothetical protein
MPILAQSKAMPFKRLYLTQRTVFMDCPEPAIHIPLDSQVVQRIKKEISFSYRARPLAQLLKPTMYSKRPHASISYFIVTLEAVAF